MNIVALKSLKNLFLVSVFLSSAVCLGSADDVEIPLDGSPENFYRLFDAEKLPIRSMIFDSGDGPGSLWFSTTPLRERSILQTASLGDSFVDQSMFSAKIIANRVYDRAFVFKDFLTIQPIISIATQLNLTEVKVIFENKELIDLLETISFSTERASVFFELKKKYKKFSLIAQMPILIQASHLWMPLDRQKKISSLGDSGISGPNQEISDDTQPLSPAAMADLKKQISEISVTGGLGDLRLSGHYSYKLNNKQCKVLLGLSALIPTQSLFQEKSQFKRSADDDGNGLGWLEFMEPAVLKGLAEKLIRTLLVLGGTHKIGQGSGSVGLMGGFQIIPGSNTNLYGIGELVYNFPVNNYRLIHKHYITDDGDKFLANLPKEYLVRSNPGEILRLSAGIRQKWAKKFTFELAADLFLQKSERIEHVFTDSENEGKLFILNDGSSAVSSATMGGARQAMVALKVDKQINLKSASGALSFDFRKTVFSAGIGEQWSVSVGLSSIF